MKSLALCISFLFAVTQLFGQAPGGGAEGRLREQIKALTGQLRTAEAEKLTLQTDKTALDEEIKKLKKGFEELTKQMAAEKDTAAKLKEKLEADVAARDKEIADVKKLQASTEAQGKLFAASSAKFEAESKKLKGENTRLKDTVENHRAKNRKMYEISMDVLNRYSKFGLGTALTAREPFVGITRARIESMMEELGGDLDAQRIKIDGTSPKPVPAKAEGEAKDRPADGKPSEKKASATKP